MGAGDVLTRREQEVLTQLRTGASTAQIAERLGIASSTVKTHITSVCWKTDARTRIDLVSADADADAIDVAGYGLSDRQSQVLRLLLRGCSNREMAQELWLSVETVKDHLARIYERLGVRSRYEAVARVRADRQSAPRAAA